MKIIDYRVVNGSSGSCLMGYVKELIKADKGWEPIGGMVISGHGSMVLFYQAMVRKEHV